MLDRFIGFDLLTADGIFLADIFPRRPTIPPFSLRSWVAGMYWGDLLLLVVVASFRQAINSRMRYRKRYGESEMSSDAYALMLFLDVSIRTECPDFQEFQDSFRVMSKILYFHNALLFTISFNIRTKPVKTVFVYNEIF